MKRTGNLGPQWFYPWVRSFDITPETAAIQPRFLTQDRFLRPAVPGEHQAAGNVSLEVGPENFGWFLYSMFGNVTSSQSAAGTSTQYQFSFGTTFPTIECETDNGFIEEWYSGGWVNSATLAVNRNSILSADLDMRFQQYHAITAGNFPTPTYSALDPFTDMKGSIERDDGVETDMDGFSMTLNLGVLDFKRFGERYVTDVLPGKPDIGWELSAAFTDDDEARRFLGDKTGTNQQNISDRFETVKIEWEFLTGQNTVDAGPHQLIFTAYGGAYISFPQPISSDSEILRARPRAIIRYDSGEACELKVFLRCDLGNLFWAQ